MQRDILPIFCHKTRTDTINEGRNCKYKQLRYKPSKGNRAAFVCTLQIMRSSSHLWDGPPICWRTKSWLWLMPFFSHRSKTFLYALDCQRWSAVPDCWKCSGPWLPMFFSSTRIRYFRYFFSIFFSQYLSAPLASYDARGALGHVWAHKATKRQEEIWVMLWICFFRYFSKQFLLISIDLFARSCKVLLLLKVLFSAARHDICQKLYTVKVHNLRHCSRSHK